MTDIIKICKIHGQLDAHQIYNYDGSKLCKLCHKLRQEKWNKKNTDKLNEKANRWRSKNPIKLKEIKQKNWYKHHEKNITMSREKYQKHKIKRQEEAIKKYHKNPHIGQNARLKRIFGITLGQYNALQDKQNNLCAICKNPETMKDNRKVNPRKLAVDHCHETKKIRGLLCFNCNIGLGKFKDSLFLLQSAIDYLKS